MEQLTFNEIVGTGIVGSPEINERLEALFGQHAVLTEQLRELQREVPKNSQLSGKTGWCNLESQVSRLRHEIENFKEVFAPASNRKNTIFNGERIQFLTLEV